MILIITVSAVIVPQPVLSALSCLFPVGSVFSQYSSSWLLTTTTGICSSCPLYGRILIIISRIVVRDKTSSCIAGWNFTFLLNSPMLHNLLIKFIQTHVVYVNKLIQRRHSDLNFSLKHCNDCVLSWLFTHILISNLFHSRFNSIYKLGSITETSQVEYVLPCAATRPAWFRPATSTSRTSRGETCWERSKWRQSSLRSVREHSWGRTTSSKY